MAISEGWEARFLYAFLIGKKDRVNKPIEQERVEDVLVELFEKLKKALGGFTKMKPFEATGETSCWGNEPTTVVLVLAEVKQENIADSELAERAHLIAKTLNQDSVWITKQKLGLYAANHSA
jgi:hypothetical protein